MQIFAGVLEIRGIKQKSGCLRCRFSYLSLAIFSESASPKLKSATHSICVKLLRKHDKLTQCCRTFTLALARLSCLTSISNRLSSDINLISFIAILTSVILSSLACSTVFSCASTSSVSLFTACACLSPPQALPQPSPPVNRPG